MLTVGHSTDLGYRFNFFFADCTTAGRHYVSRQVANEETGADDHALDVGEQEQTDLPSRQSSVEPTSASQPEPNKSATQKSALSLSEPDEKSAQTTSQKGDHNLSKEAGQPGGT